jgi:hypothetical protein
VRGRGREAVWEGEEEARLLFEAGERGRFVGIFEAEVETWTLLFEREEEVGVRR